MKEKRINKSSSMEHEKCADEEPNRIFVKHRRVRLVFMTLLLIQVGLYNGIIALAVPELQGLLHCDIAKLSSTLMFQFLGVLFGSMTGAIFCDIYRKHSDLALFLASFVAGLTNISVPWSPNLTVLGTLFFIAGMCQAVMDTMSNSLAMLEWEEMSGPPVNLLHAAYTLGLVLAPPTVVPFLSPDNPNFISVKDNMSYVYNSTVTHIYIPYGFHGVFGLAAAVPFLCFYVYNWNYKEVDETSHKWFMSKLPIKDKFTVAIAFVGFTLTCLMMFRENTIALLNFKIAIEEPLNFSRRTAGIYVTVYNMCWLISRTAGVFLAYYIPSHWIMFGVMAITLTENILLLVLGLNSQLHYWIITCALPLFFGPYYPCLVAWINQYVSGSGVIVAAIITGLGLGGFIADWISGYLYLHYGSTAIFALVLAGTLTMLLISIPVHVLFSKRGHRFKEKPLGLQSQSSNSCLDKENESIPLISGL